MNNFDEKYQQLGTEQWNVISNYLTNSAGQNNMKVNGSVTPQSFKYQFSLNQNQEFIMTRILLTLQGVNTNKFESSQFGNIDISAGNGLQINTKQGGQLFNFKSNRDVSAMCYDTEDSFQFVQNAGSFYTARITLAKFSERGLIFRNDDFIEALIRDNLSSNDMEYIQIIIQGYKRQKSIVKDF